MTQKNGKSSILPTGDAPSCSHFSSKSEAFQGVPSGRLERYYFGWGKMGNNRGNKSGIISVIMVNTGEWIYNTGE